MVFSIRLLKGKCLPYLHGWQGKHDSRSPYRDVCVPQEQQDLPFPDNGLKNL
jgi:hypothetical protein